MTTESRLFPACATTADHSGCPGDVPPGREGEAWVVCSCGPCHGDVVEAPREDVA